MPDIVAEQRSRCGKSQHLSNGQRKFLGSTRTIHVPESVAKYVLDRPTPWLRPDVISQRYGKVLSPGRVWYELAAHTDCVCFEIHSKLGGFARAELLALNDEEPPTLATEPEVRENGQIWYRDVVPGLDIYLHIGLEYVEIFKKLYHEKAPRAFTWRITESDPPAIRVKTDTAGHDNSGFVEPTRSPLGPGRIRRRIQMRHRLTEQLSLPGTRTYTFREQWTGKTIDVDPITRVKRLDSAVVYPVLIDATFSQQVSANANDGQANSSGTWQTEYAGGGYHLAWGSGNGWRPGHRFTSVTIGQGDTIDSADMTVDRSSPAGTTTGPYRGNDVDDAAAWSNGDNPSNMTTTTAKHDYSSSGGGLKTFSITAVVQEIVDRTGWASGNDMKFGFNAITSNSSQWVYFVDVAGSDPDTADLDVTYTPAPAGGGPTPAIMMSSNF